MTSNISIEEMMEKIALENDCNGKMLERYNLVGCSPSVRLEYIDNDDWEVCLSKSLIALRSC